MRNRFEKRSDHRRKSDNSSHIIAPDLFAVLGPCS